MSFFKANMQTGILVLLVILVGILCIAIFFTNKEVRNIKVDFVKSRHDITALQTLLNDIGLTAVGGRLDLEDLPENIIDRGNDGPPIEKFPINGLQSNVVMLPSKHYPSGFNSLDTLDEKDEQEYENPDLKVSKENEDFAPLPANTDSEPAILNLENPVQQDAKDVIPAEDIDEVKEQESKKQPNQSLKTQTNKTNEVKKEEEENESSEEESSDEESSEEESSDEDDK